MRRLAISALVLAASVMCVAARDESLSDLKARAEHAGPEERPGLCLQVAERQLHNADQLYNDGKVEEARAAVDDVVAYSEQARDAAIHSKRHMKAVEITVRKMSEKLRDIRRTLAFEDQPPVEQAMQRLEDIRTVLLKEMFKKDKK